MGNKIGIDIGGTYTDLVFMDGETGELRELKTPSTPDDLTRGVFEGLDSLKVDLSSVDYIVHGSTIGVNTLIQHNGAKTGLLTTTGFEDVLEIGTMSKPDMYNLFYQKPRPLVNREFRLGIDERVTADGEILTPVQETQVREALSKLVDAGIESVAIVTLHSYANPENEKAIAEFVRREFPGLAVSVSHEIANERREVERGTTAVINAYIQPPVRAYLKDLEERLRQRNFQGLLFLLMSSGGSMTADRAGSVPVHTLLSGPVAGSIGGEVMANSLGNPNVITFDMGGTSCDISVIRDGSNEVSYEVEVEGYPVFAPMVEISYLGAGGGSIARVLGDISLRVGPESAGADPGPAAYGRGGQFPTVTDANLVLGRLDPDAPLTGGIPADLSLAREAIEREVAKKLDMTVEEAALGIIEVACIKMAYAIRGVTVEKGLDPRDFTLVSFGGAGAMHTPFIAPMMGIRQILIPWSPGTFCAWGMLNTDIRHDLAMTVDYRGRKMDAEELNDLFGRLEAEGHRLLESEGVSEDRRRFRRQADVRYRGQEHPLTVLMEQGPIDEEALVALADSFHRAHHALYGHSVKDDAVEVVSIRLEASGALEKAGLPNPRRDGSTHSGASPTSSRTVVFPGGSFDTPVYFRSELLAGFSLQGPAVVNEDGSTTIVPPDCELTVDDHRNLMITVPEEEST